MVVAQGGFPDAGMDVGDIAFSSSAFTGEEGGGGEDFVPVLVLESGVFSDIEEDGIFSNETGQGFDDGLCLLGVSAEVVIGGEGEVGAHALGFGESSASEDGAMDEDGLFGHVHSSQGSAQGEVDGGRCVALVGFALEEIEGFARIAAESAFQGVEELVIEGDALVVSGAVLEESLKCDAAEEP